MESNDSGAAPALPEQKDVKASIRALLFTTPKERITLGLPSSSKEALNEVAKIIWEDLKRRGSIFHSGGAGYLLLENHVPIAVSKDGHDFSYLMSEDYLLQPGQSEKDHVGKFIGMMCVKEGKKTELRVGTHYASESKTCYFSELRGYMVRITKDSAERVPNGTDGIVFLFPEGYEEINIMAFHPFFGHVSLFGTQLQSLLFEGLTMESGDLSVEERKRLIETYLITLFMPGIVREKMLFTSLGPTGSGKTFALRVIGRLLVGRGFEVSDLSGDKKELETVLVNRPFVVFDDVAGVSKEVLAIVKKAVTGGTMQRRELYTTSRLAEEPYRAHIAVTSVTSPFHGTEETNRMLVLTLTNRNAFTSEKETLRTVDMHRGSFLAEMVARVQFVLRALDKVPHLAMKTMPIRLAGFATLFTQLYAATTDKGAEKALDILTRWGKEQEGQVLYDNDLADAIRAFIKSPEFTLNDTLVASQLLDRLKKYMSGKPYWSESAERLAHALIRSEVSFKSQFGLTITSDSHTKTRVYSFAPPFELKTGPAF